MNKKLLLIQMLLLAISTTGCSLAPYKYAPAETTTLPRKPPADATSQRQAANIDPVKQKIYRQHRNWKGTPYSLGGMSKRGIDCSGLVYDTYLEHFGIELPRTTTHQAQTGKAVNRNNLRAGDLVFFKTGRRTRHVGIYIENNRFFHASTKHGVTISTLNDAYWKDKYWLARRIDFLTSPLLLEK